MVGGRCGLCPPVPGSDIEGWEDADPEVLLDVGATLNDQHGDESLIYEVNYCLVRGDRRRIWGLLLPGDRVYYPMFWDPRHQVSGHGERYAQRAAGTPPPPCPDECLHPDRVARPGRAG